jgi:hypothetical protein
MAKQASDSRVIGPRETKAIHTLMSAKNVAREVEELRRRLTDPYLTPAQTARSTAVQPDLAGHRRDQRECQRTVPPAFRCAAG